MSAACPACGSEHTRRGGYAIWTVYVLLIAAAVVAVLTLHLHAGLVAAVMLAVTVISNLVVDQRVCSDCGHQWNHRRSPER